MDADRIHVFHAADRDGIVLGVTHDFVLDFLIAGNRLLNQALVHRGHLETGIGDVAQFFFIVGKAAAGAAECIRRSDNQRVTLPVTESDCFLNAVNDDTLRNRLMDFLHQGPEHLPVFSLVDGLQIGAEDLHPEFIQDPVIVQIDDQVQAGLPAQRSKDGVRTFLENNPFGGFKRQRFDIDPVRNGRIGHNRGRIGVDQDNFVALLTQSCTGL